MDNLRGDVAQIANLFVAAKVPNSFQIAAGIDDINIAVLADDSLGLSLVHND